MFVLRAIVVAATVPLVAALGVPAAHADPTGYETPTLADVDTLVDEAVPQQLAEGEIPGSIVTVVADGKTVLPKGYGVSDVESGAPTDPATAGFYTASEAKLFTATAALQLVKKRKLDLHADVNDYLKDFAVPDTYPRGTGHSGPSASCGPLSRTGSSVCPLTLTV